jgi:transposase
MARFKFYQSDPTFLLPQRVGDMIPEDDVAWVIMEVVDRLDVSLLTNKYSFKGSDGFHPTLLLKLIFYGVAIGSRSSRKIARLARKDLGGIMLAGGEQPSWRTIARFLKTNENEIKGLFQQVLQLCIALEMVSFGQFSLDGTKIKANAYKSGTKAEVIAKRIVDLKNEIEQAITEMKTNDQNESTQFGESTPDELPKEIRTKQERLKKLDQALNELNKRAEVKGEKLKPDDRYNFVDPDSRLLRTSRNGFQQCYNHQAVVDKEQMIIVAYTTSQEASDIEQLQPTLEESKANTNRDPETFTADTGYFSGKNLAYLEDNSIDAYICPKQEDGVYHKDNFTYDAERDIYICPGQRELTYHSKKTKRKDTTVWVYWGNCSGCPHCSQCIKSKTGKRQIERSQYDLLREKMKAKHQTEAAKEIYSHRKELSEPVFGQLKQQQNFHQHLRRGLNSVRSEFGLACLVYNIKRIWHKYNDYQGTKCALENVEQKICFS